MTRSKAAIWLAAMAFVSCPAPTSAQDSRAEVIEQQQETKAKQLTPEAPGTVEKWFIRIKNDLVLMPSGFYPSFDSVYSGGSFTLGAGYRHYYADTSFWNVVGNYSILGYKHLGASTTSHFMQNRLNLTARAGWRDATQVDYFGLGNSTLPEDATNFRFKQTYAGGGAHLRPVPWIRLAAAAEYEQYRDESGTGTSPSIEQIHTPLTAPGLGAEPSYIHSLGAAAIDWRTSPGYSRRGGLYGATLHNYSDRDDTYSFNQMELDLVQDIPILRENWVISMRGHLESVLDDDDVVPYYLLPSLGGGSSLRGYSSWRWRDRHSLLTSVEWRWIPNVDGFDMALFYDAGEVASRLEDIDTKGWHHDWGIGARFHGPISTPLRIEMARGSEGWHLVFAGSAAF